jgi:hypothetical protein
VDIVRQNPNFRKHFQLIVDFPNVIRRNTPFRQVPA